jgi:hypothetical protein
MKSLREADAAGGVLEVSDELEAPSLCDVISSP